MIVPANAKAADIPNAGKVHVWVGDLKASSSSLETLERSLNSDERQQAAKFRFEHNRDQYVFAQGFLRDVLSRYVGTPQNRILFEQNAFGKPFIPAESTHQIRFNLSRSKELVIIGVAKGSHVGIDVEFVQSMNDSVSIAKQYFTKAEQDLINASEPEHKQRAFFACWTRKEAYIKAVGKGLSISLSSFDVSMTPGTIRRSLPPSVDLPEVQAWSLIDLNLPSPYVGALVVEGDSVDVLYFNWSR